MHRYELVAAVDDAARRLSQAKSALHEFDMKACGLQIGSIVRSKGKEYKVASVGFFRDGDLFWLKGCQRRKNGSWGGREYYVDRSDGIEIVKEG